MIDVQKYIYICFIYYTKAFDEVRHEKLPEILQQLDVDWKDIQLLQNLYWEQSAVIGVENELSKCVPIERGVRQGCVMSLDMFNLYSEFIFRGIDELPEIIVGGKSINNLRCADDTALTADSKEKFQILSDNVVAKSRDFGLSINCKKMESMVISKKPRVEERMNMKIKSTTMKQVKAFMYLGSSITENGKSEEDIKKRIGIS